MPLTVSCQIRQLSLSILCPSHFGSTPKPPIWFLDVAEFCPITALTCLGLCADPFSHSQLDRQLSFCLFEHLPSSSPLASSAEAVTHLTPGFHFRLQLLLRFGLHCCDKTLTRTSVGEEGVHLSYILTVYHWGKPKQGPGDRNEADHGGRKLSGLLNLVSSATFHTQSRPACPGMAPSTNSWTLLHQLTTKKTSHGRGHRPIWWRQFLS